MLPTLQYSLDVIRDEAQEMLKKGLIHRHQPLYILCCYFPAQDWNCIECELERNDFLLRDQISDLIGSEEWLDD